MHEIAFFVWLYVKKNIFGLMGRRNLAGKTKFNFVLRADDPAKRIFLFLYYFFGFIRNIYFNFFGQFVRNIYFNLDSSWCCSSSGDTGLPSVEPAGSKLGHGPWELTPDYPAETSYRRMKRRYVLPPCYSRLFRKRCKVLLQMRLTFRNTTSTHTKHAEKNIT